MNSKIFLQIVQTWNLSQNPEYRGFRCANCQKYMRKAWHHWLDGGGYKTPVHFCNDCENNFRLSKIEVKKPQIKVDRVKFNPELPEKIKSRIVEISRNWNTALRPLYKMFVCDQCGSNMVKAWHVWANLRRGLLIETHFCKKCGGKLGFLKKIKGIIYDLDGTLISTLKLHREAWLTAGRKFGVPITEEMLTNQRGISDGEAALMMLPSDKKRLLEKFVKVKQKYVKENVRKIALFPGTAETINALTRAEYKVWICTSAHRFFAAKVLKLSKSLKKAVGNNVVWREMYKHPKPQPDALNLTSQKMGLNNLQVIYVGDAFSDYKTSLNAGIKFIYFCPDIAGRDPRILKTVPVISSHGQIFKFL